MYNNYEKVSNDTYRIKMEFMEKFIDPELVFVEVHNLQIFHVMILEDNRLRLIVFNEEELKSLHNGGRVVGFNDNHHGLNKRSSNLKDIYQYLREHLSSEKYQNFEKWAITNL